MLDIANEFSPAWMVGATLIKAVAIALPKVKDKVFLFTVDTPKVIDECQESYNDTRRKAFLLHQSWTILIPYKFFS
jgi:hypothetical protein